MDNNKISVIVPIYNVEKYLAECLDSILMQDYPSYELLLIDDKSTDSSLVIAQTYAESYKQIKVIALPQNGGQSVARNHGLQVATGNYIIFVDSDDLLTESNAFTQLVEELEKNNVDMVITPIIGYNEITGAYYQDGYHQFSGIDPNNLLNNIAWVNVSPCARIHKASIIKDNKITFPTGLKFEDNIFFWHYYLASNQKITLLEKPHYLYRATRKGNTTNTVANFDDASTISTIMIDLFKQYNLYHQIKPSLDCYVWWSFYAWTKGRNNTVGSYSYFKKFQPLLKQIDTSWGLGKIDKLAFKLVRKAPLLAYFYCNIVFDNRFHSLISQYRATILGGISLKLAKLVLLTILRTLKLIKGILLFPIKTYLYATRPVK